MTPFFAMLTLFGFLHLPALGERVPPGRRGKAACALGISLTLAACMHFVRPDLFMRMVPSWIPAPALVVFVSGVVELLVGVGLLVPRTRRIAAWSAVALFIAIWPGSIYVALSGNYPEMPTSSPLYHRLRVPFHALYVAWALWIARAPRTTRSASRRSTQSHLHRLG